MCLSWRWTGVFLVRNLAVIDGPDFYLQPTGLLPEGASQASSDHRDHKLAASVLNALAQHAMGQQRSISPSFVVKMALLPFVL